MSLIEDIQRWYDDESHPPDPLDLGDDVDLMSEETLGDLRWGTQFVNVYRKGDEFVAVEDVRPATEMQDWGDYGKPEIYPVAPRVEIVERVVYDRVAE